MICYFVLNWNCLFYTLILVCKIIFYMLQLYNIPFYIIQKNWRHLSSGDPARFFRLNFRRSTLFGIRKLHPPGHITPGCVIWKAVIRRPKSGEKLQTVGTQFSKNEGGRKKRKNVFLMGYLPTLYTHSRREVCWKPESSLVCTSVFFSIFFSTGKGKKKSKSSALVFKV